MTALPDVFHVIKAVHEGTDETGAFPWATVSHWMYTKPDGSAITAGELAVVAPKFVNSWRDHIRPWTGSNVIDTQVVLTDLTTTSSAVAISLDGDAGTGSSPAISPESAMLVSKSIARRYRGGHPRTYWIGPYSNASTVDPGRSIDASLAVAFKAGLAAYYTDIPPAVTTDSSTGCSAFQEVMVSYVDAALNPVPPHRRAVPLVDPVVAYTVHTIFATQRRRMHRNG